MRRAAKSKGKSARPEGRRRGDAFVPSRGQKAAAHAGERKRYVAKRAFVIRQSSVAGKRVGTKRVDVVQRYATQGKRPGETGGGTKGGHHAAAPSFSFFHSTNASIAEGPVERGE